MNETKQHTVALTALQAACAIWTAEEDPETVYWTAERLDLINQTQIHRLIARRGFDGNLNLITEGQSLDRRLKSWYQDAPNHAVLEILQRFAAAYCWTLTEAAKD